MNSSKMQCIVAGITTLFVSGILIFLTEYLFWFLFTGVGAREALNCVFEGGAVYQIVDFVNGLSGLRYLLGGLVGLTSGEEIPTTSWGDAIAAMLMVVASAVSCVFVAKKQNLKRVVVWTVLIVVMNTASNYGQLMRYLSE